MNVNSLKTKDSFHNYVTIKQSDNTSPIEVLLCDSKGALLSNLNEDCTVSIYDAISKEVRQISEEKIINGVLSFRIVNDLFPYTHKLEVTTYSGVKFPADDDFQIFVSESHNSKLINIIKSIPTELALKVVTQQVMNRFNSISDNFVNYIKKGEVTVNDLDVREKKITKEYISDDLINSIQSSEALSKENQSKFTSYVKKGEVTVGDIDKNKGLLDASFFSSTFLSQLKGGTINATNVLDGSITVMKLADKAVSNSKLSDFFSSVRQLNDGENLTSFSKEGIYFKPTMIRLTDIPPQLTDGGIGTSGFLIVKPYSQYHYVQEFHDLNNTGVVYTRVVKNNANAAWKSNSDDEKVKALSNEQTNNKLQYNLNVFEKRSNEVIPDKNIAYANAIQDIRIEGVDPDIPIKIWILCRAFSTWNYRIILGKYEDGAWSTLLDTGTAFTVTENTTGATNVEYSSNGITLKARIDYNVIPTNDRILDHSAMTDEPYFIIRPKKVGTYVSGGDGIAYDQSLNTTDNVRFASVQTDSLEVTGQLPTGTLASPPVGLLKGDMWLDTTDSATQPIVRFML